MQYHSVTCYADQALWLIKQHAVPYQLLSKYECKEAIERFNRLPTSHINTGMYVCMYVCMYVYTFFCATCYSTLNYDG